MKQGFVLAIAAAMALCGLADEIAVTRFSYSGAVPVPQALALGDTAKVKMVAPMEIAVASELPQGADMVDLSEGVAPWCDDAPALHVLEFDAENRGYASAELVVEGLKEYEAYCDGKKASGKIDLHPATHKFRIKYLSRPGQPDSLRVRLSGAPDGALAISSDGMRMMVLDDVLCGTRPAAASISPSGAYVIADYATSMADGAVSRTQRLYDAKTGRMLGLLPEHAEWMPNSDRYYVARDTYEHGRQLVAIDPATRTEEVLASRLPEGDFVVCPGEDALIYLLTREGAKENPKAYMVLEPEDRQPGWRDRAYPAIWRFGQDALLPLAYGVDNAYLSDISADGKRALLMVPKSRLEKRPTTVTTVIDLDLASMRADTIIAEGEFINTVSYSPDGSMLLVSGTPEAFGRIGCVLPDSVIPSMVQTELFVVDIASKQARPITRDFPYNPQQAVWSLSDGKIYARAEKRDHYAVYRIDPATCAWQEIELPEMLARGFSLADKAPAMAWWGQSDSNADRLYATDLKKGKTLLLDAPSDERYSRVRRAKCEDWNFVNSKGDTIYGRRYLPDNFDPAKKYPLIVNYYGGCSPSQRYFESRYPWHVYSQLGYVIYVVQPSGATGFGQEFSSRHVNTAGRGPAEDIIEGTRKFLAEHPYVDAARVGCIGASYGGFMTMYLQTVTDLFAAAVSHAGISDHTSYWGEGYWGYSYSEVSMAESYPWSDPELYVKQSPLYNADKVHTPILFLHGDGDTNVPPGESIQMFTALKLLGRPTALVEIQGQNHHISEFERRRLWQDAIFAWFAMHLQGDSAWWEAMYPAQKEF